MRIITSNANPVSGSIAIKLSSPETSIGRHEKRIATTEKEITFIKRLLDKEPERQENISTSSSLIDVFPAPLKIATISS